MSRIKWFLVLFVCVSADESEDVGDFKKKEPGFLLAHTKTFLSGKNETVCLILHDAVVPTRALLDLKIKDKHHTITKIMHSDYSCFELPVPQHNSTEVLSASLHLQMLLNGTIYSSHNHHAILIYPNLDVTFVETDRSTYKPGDLVRIRVLVLNQDLRPTTRQNAVQSLKVINPHGFKVSVWERVDTELGLAQLEYQLTDDTVLGKWKIECNGIFKYFHVKRYVLPRFKVVISAPKTLYARAKHVEINVCARYSFQQPVKGIALLKISYPHVPHTSTSKIMKMQDGCANFHLTNEDLRFSSVRKRDRSQFTMSVVATVTEQGTNKVETESLTSTVKGRPMELRFAEENIYFQPGLPYKGRLKVVDNHDRSDVHYVQVCYQLAVKKPWNIKPEECSELKVDEDRLVHFSILPVKESIVEIKLTARVSNHTDIEDTYVILKKWYSSSNSYLRIERNSKLVSKCKSPQQYTVYYNTNKFRNYENVTFYYMLKTMNTILQMRRIHHTPRRYVINFKNELTNVLGSENRFVKSENYVDRFILKFRLHNSVLSRSQLVVFYFNRDETVAGGIDVFVEKCLSNHLDAQWTETTVYPGEKATLKVNTSPNSLCAVSSTDKSSSFMSSSKWFNVHNILQPFLQPRETKPSNKPNCLLSHKKKNEPVQMENIGDLRRKRSYGGMIISKDYDSFELFNQVGISAITNTKMISKPCLPEERGPHLEPRLFSMSSTEYEVQNEDKGVSLRSYFPETWLWELIPVGQSGRAQIARNVPHSITAWTTNVLCVSPTEGVGISSKQEMLAFQPFFVDVLLPYSVKRYETFHLQVSVFNYLNYSLPIRITLSEVDGLKLLDNSNRKKYVFYCLSAQDVQVHTFRVRGEKLGAVNITVSTEIESSYPRECGPETIINKRDVVLKQLLIEPEGFATEFSKSVLLCGNDDANNITWDVEVPNQIIDDSQSAKVIFNSDLMGPTVQNLEKLIQMPTGCGEQIMAVMAPNLYVLRYLKATNALTPSLRQRAVKNLKIGYQRILDYVHKDGSFSAFGYHDPAGSMFLTAFVVRTLQQAKEYTYVDSRVINKAVEWIVAHQLENGCFSAVSHVFQDMGGTSTENSTAALTAYVIISLMESKLTIPKSVQLNAQYCIRGQYNPDKYTLSISTYALYLLDWVSEADRYLTRLLEIATREGKLLWWSDLSGPSSVNVEMTSYVLKSLLHKITNENLVQASAVVRWLATQRSSHGGFFTTQDTVVALDAISRYTSVVKNREPELKLKVSGAGHMYNLTMQKNDRIKAKEVTFESMPRDIHISATGHGCVLAQLSVNYNVMRMISSEAFTLAVEVNPVSTIDKCSVAVISPCISYKATGSSNMAVLEVSMPSGYEPDRTSLFKLTEQNNTKVKRFEEHNDKVVLYFTELTNEPICVPFSINENVIVEDQMEATMKVYDYYNPDLKVFSTYKVNKCQDNTVSLIPEFEEVKRSKLTTKAVPNETNSESKRRVREDCQINCDFVDVDFEMATPSGIEGNIPIYVNPNTTDDLDYRGV